MEQKKNILLHIPHSSTAFPEGSGYTFNDLNDEERLLIDYYTDGLFAPLHSSEQISDIVFPYCRLYCDVERLINDPLEEEGLGISYRRFTRGHPKTRRSFSTLSSAFELYADHHATMSKEIVRKQAPVLLLDCHSFSSLPNLLNFNPPNIDICVGFNDDSTCPSEALIKYIVQYFQSLGYKVGINNPFSNSKTFEVPVVYHSIMIEVNKRLYMDEQSLEKTAGFDRVRKEIQALYDYLLE